MTVRFHPPDDPDAYVERVLTVLVRSALPRIMERLDQLRRQEARKGKPTADVQKP